MLCGDIHDHKLTNVFIYQVLIHTKEVLVCKIYNNKNLIYKIPYFRRAKTRSTLIYKTFRK